MEILKKIAKISTLVALIGSFSYADSQPKTFVGYDTLFVTSESKNIFDIQPASEIIGEGGVEHRLKYGWIMDKDDNVETKVYLYGWSNSERNSEIGFGLGGDVAWTPGFAEGTGLKLVLGGSAGYGWQDVKGDTVNISTNANKVNYINGSASKTPTQATFQDDTTVIDIALNLGMTYEFTKNLNLNFGYVYKYSTYQVAYRNADASSVLNAINFNQDNHAVLAGLQYKF